MDQCDRYWYIDWRVIQWSVIWYVIYTTLSKLLNFFPACNEKFGSSISRDHCPAYETALISFLCCCCQFSTSFNLFHTCFILCLCCECILIFLFSACALTFRLFLSFKKCARSLRCAADGAFSLSLSPHFIHFFFVLCRKFIYWCDIVNESECILLFLFPFGFIHVYVCVIGVVTVLYTFRNWTEWKTTTTTKWPNRIRRYNALSYDTIFLREK